MLFETLIYIDSLTSHLSSGVSVLRAIEISAHEHKSKISDFSKYFLKAIQNGESAYNVCLKLKKTENRFLFLILEMGVKGMPILKMLEELHTEVRHSNDMEIEEFNKILPFKLMIPLIFCYFPAIMVLFIGPFVQDFLSFSKSM